MNNIKKHWWKALAVILLVYTFIFSLTVPLAPKIKTALPKALHIGENKVILTGYNTQFDADEAIEAYLEYDKKVIAKAKNINILNPNQISVVFTIPEALPSKILHLRVNTTRFTTFSPEIIKAIDCPVLPALAVLPLLCV